MSEITCNCGNIYDSGFKFCPECATSNPDFTKKQSQDPSAPKQMKKKFTKVGESSLNKGSSEPKPLDAKRTSSPSPATKQKTTPQKRHTLSSDKHMSFQQNLCSVLLYIRNLSQNLTLFPKSTMTKKKILHNPSQQTITMTMITRTRQITIQITTDIMMTGFQRY